MITLVTACAAPRPRDFLLERKIPSLSSGANTPRDETVLQRRYDFDAWLQAQPKLPEHAILISISGGSTRSAAMAQSVLAALGQFQLPPDGKQPVRTLADNVVAISAVSGGAMTAAAFVIGRAACLDTETTATCDERSIGQDGDFNKTILQKNLLKFFLLNSVASPLGWHDRAEPWVEFFEHAYPVDTAGKPYTFGDLGMKPRAPFLILNSTDVPNDRTFSFVQNNFNYLCADLNKEPVAVGVAAAGNFPFLSSDIVMRNFRTKGCDPEPVTPSVTKKLHDQMENPYGNQDTDDPPDSHDIEDARDSLDRATWARYKLGMLSVVPGAPPSPIEDDNKAADWTDPVRRIDWLHLYDGGIADNLGLWPLVFLLSDGPRLQKMHELGVKDITLLVVNARWDWTPWGNESSPSPGLITQLAKNIAFDPLNRATALTENLAFDRLKLKYQTICRNPKICDAAKLPLELYPVVLDFDQLTGSPELLQLREEVKNIGDEESLGDAPPNYQLANNSCGDQKCEPCPDKICVVERAGRTLLARNPCMKKIYEKFELEYDPRDLDTLPGPAVQPDAQTGCNCPVIKIGPP